MKFTVARAPLLKALEFVTRTVERRTTIPILANVRIDADEDGVLLTATNLNMEARTRVAGNVHTAGVMTVPAATLFDIVRKLAEGMDVGFEGVDNLARLTIKSGRAKFNLESLPVADWPDLAAGDLPHNFVIPARDLAYALQKTAFAVSTEETRYYLNGIYLHVTQDAAHLRFVATDGHRLARFEMVAPAGVANAPDMPGIIIPRATVAELEKWAAKAPTDSQFNIALSAQKIAVKQGDTRLISKLIDGTFPDYQRVIPSKSDKKARLDKAALAAVIDRVSTVSTEKSRGVKMDFGDGALELSVHNPNMGAAEETIEADIDFAPLAIGFNSRYLLDALNVLDGETVHFEVTDPGSPALVSDEKGTELLIVLMPMRV